MSIEVHCHQCAYKFRVPEQYACKRIKCPKCQAILQVPPSGPATSSGGDIPSGTAAVAIPASSPSSRSAATAPTISLEPSGKAVSRQDPPSPVSKPTQSATSPQPAPDPAPDVEEQWYLQTEDGQQYGPVGKDELDAWFDDGRIDTSCQLLCEGWEEWQWADAVYPQLVESSPEGEIAAAPGEESFAAAGEDTPWSGGSEEIAVNPYATPRTAPSSGTQRAQASEAGITAKVRQEFAETRPWLTFLSILGFVSAGLGVLGAVFTILGGVMSGVLMLSFAGLIMLAILAIPMVSAYLLFTFGSKLGLFLKTDKTRDLESAMTAQKQFWKFTGILACIGLGLQLLLMALASFGGLIGMGR